MKWFTGISLLVGLLTACSEIVTDPVNSLPAQSGSAQAVRGGRSTDGLTLSCQGNVQPNGPGTDVLKKALSITKETESNTVLEGTLEGFKLKVDWNHSLTTLYMSIDDEAGNNLLFATSRIPDESHNDSMVDLSIPGEPRVYISCDFEEFRPSANN